MATHSSILAWRMDRGVWWTMVHRIVKSQTQLKQLSTHTHVQRSSLVLLEEGVCYDQCVLFAKLCEPLPCFILYSKAKLGALSR